MLDKSKLEIAVPNQTKPITRVGREAAKYLLRLPDDLFDFLRKEANFSGRSMNSEIIIRLEETRQRQLGTRKRTYISAEPTAPDYAARTDTERAILAVFRRMPPEKQLALLSLFK